MLSYQSVDDRLVPSNIYDSLISFLPRLKGIEYAKLYPEQQTGDGSIEHPFQMPFYIYADVVREFEKEVYKFEKDHPEFQLNTYNNIFLMNGLRWDEEVMTKADVSNANGQVVIALILGAIRAERFCDGALKDFLELGCIEKWLLRLQEIASKI